MSVNGGFWIAIIELRRQNKKGKEVNKMTEAIITAASTVAVGLLSLAGVMITNSRSNNRVHNEIKTAQAVTAERINELTRELKNQNEYVKQMPALEEKMKSINRRIYNLEGYHNVNPLIGGIYGINN